MNRWQLVKRSLQHHVKSHAAVAAAVAVATAVLTGALLIGDSVRGSLRDLVLARLGKTDYALVTDRFFDQALLRDITDSKYFQEHLELAAGISLVRRATVEHQKTGSIASNVVLIGCDDDFFELANGAEEFPTIADDEIVINVALAKEMRPNNSDWRDVVGDNLVIRLPNFNQVPSESPLGRRETGRSLAGLRVTAVVSNTGLGGFQLSPTQQNSLNAFVSLATIQRALRQPSKINAILVADREQSSEDTSREDDPRALDVAHQLNLIIQPRLADFGATVEQVRQVYQPAGEPEQLAFEYLQLTTDRLVWEDVASRAILRSLKDQQPQEIVTYLANAIQLIDSDASVAREVPYSTIAAVDSNAALGPLGDGQCHLTLADGEIALNSWTADDLQAEVGDKIRITYFEPETTHGKAVERSADFQLAQIIPIVEPDQPFTRRRPATFSREPTRANDPSLTPNVEGVTDQAAIADWDPPFPFDESRVRTVDDDYWQNHRTTPKAFITLADGKQLWASRFGTTTSIRFAAGEEESAIVLKRARDALDEQKEELGFQFIPVKANSLRSAVGTTPFQFLFLGFSLFLIVAAIMLVALLLRLGLQQRMRDVGLLQAIGWPQPLVRRSLLVEQLLVTTVGTVLGVVLGIGYAALMLLGLRTIWVAAVVNPFLRLHATPTSIVAGLCVGILLCIIVVFLVVRSFAKQEPQSLLSGRSGTLGLASRPKSWQMCLAAVLLVVAVGCAFAASQAAGETQAGLFFGAGAATLAAALLALRWSLGRTSIAQSRGAGWSLSQLAWSGAARQPGRSVLTIGLVASATFLIVAIAAFQLEPSEEGTGGFELIAESDQPLFIDLNDEDARHSEMGDAAAALDGSQFAMLRVVAGDDASCRNLYRARQPRLIGVTDSFLSLTGDDTTRFKFAAAESSDADPWTLLRGDWQTGQPVPCILDKNTAMYSLQLYRGPGEEFVVAYDRGPTIRFRVVGLVSNSILQGSLLMSEDIMTELFPEIGGYQLLLVDTPGDSPTSVAQSLENHFGDEGLDVRSSETVLADLMAVQNTYLSTFQSLGALGLLLGTLGLAAVQVRSVIERRSELALLRSVGFPTERVGRLVAYEAAGLLAAGLAIGVGAALVAIVPHMVLGDARVPLLTVGLMLAAIAATGLVASRFAVRAAAKLPVVQALRGD